MDDVIIQLKINMTLMQLEDTIELLHAHINSNSSKQTQMMLAFLRNSLAAHHDCANAMCEKLISPQWRT